MNLVAIEFRSKEIYFWLKVIFCKFCVWCCLQKMNKYIIVSILALATMIYVFLIQKLLICHSEQLVNFQPTNTKEISHYPLKPVKEKTDAVILLTTMRSGSSIVGSIFDERLNVTYLYEPLFPFGDSGCGDEVRKDAVALLYHASTCHFEKFKGLYEPRKRFDRWAM